MTEETLSGYIDISAIDLNHVKNHSNGKKYLAITIRRIKEGTDRFGNTHIIHQYIKKDKLPTGKFPPIVGNCKPLVFNQSTGKPTINYTMSMDDKGRLARAEKQTQARAEKYKDAHNYDNEEIPF